MIPVAELLNPILWGVTAIAAAFALGTGIATKRDARLTTAALFAIAAAGLLASIAVAAWLPPAALAIHPDGSTDDPRAVSAVLLGLATLVALVPAARSLRLRPMELLGALLPGVALAGLVASVASFVGLRAPMALLGVVLGCVAAGTAVALFPRLRWSALGVFALQAAATGALVVAGVLALNGARAGLLQLREGAAVDTLGCRVMLGVVQAPSDSLRRVEFVIVRNGTPHSAWAELRGASGTELKAAVAGALLSGPVVVPLGLQEARPQAHDLVWLARGDSARAADATVRFVGFRIVPGDTVRMFADLDVVRPSGTQRVSPGMYAMKNATVPFAAVAEGLGPIAVGKLDADNGRIAIMLPTPSSSAIQRTAIFGLHTRPALPYAWAAGLLALAFALLGLSVPSESPARKR